MKKIPPLFHVSYFWCRRCERENLSRKCSICHRLCAYDVKWRRRYYEKHDITSTIPKITRRQYRKRYERSPYHFASVRKIKRNKVQKYS